MRKITLPIAATGGLALSILATPGLRAQSDASVEEEIVVFGTQGRLDSSTGSRLDLTVLQTPATVDIIDGEAIRGRLDLSSTEAITRSAGFTSEANPGNGHSSIVARGFTGSNAVTKLYDGNQIYSIADVATFPQDTWSLERIEILKGPSSVLYGQGGIGGAINLIPRRPQFERSSEIRILGGEYGTSFVGVDFTGGLSDSVAYRFDYSNEQSDGWVTNGDSETENLALALLWQATENLSFTVRYDASDEKPMNYFGSLTSNGDFIEEFVDINFNVADAETSYEDDSVRIRMDWGISDTLNLSVETYQMEADRFWRNAEYVQYFPDEGGVLRTDPLILGHDVEQDGTRAQVSFAPSSAIRLLVGVEAIDLAFARPTNWGPGNPQPIDWWNFADTIADSTGDFDVVDPYNFQAGSLSDVTPALTAVLDNFADVDQQAMFAEARFGLTERLALVAALRYEDFDSHYERVMGGFARDWSQDATTGRLGLVFDVADDLAIYGQYGTGAEHPGGTVVSFGGSFVGDAELVESEQLEFGVKKAVAGSGLQWTLAVFDITKNNLVIDDPNSSNPDDVILIDEQTSQGIEAGLNFAVTSGFQVHGNFVVLNAEDDAGETPLGVPETSWNLGLAWQASPQFRIIADARYVDDRPDGGLGMPSYTVLDASVHWLFNDRVSLMLRGDNLTDELYASGSYWSGTWITGKPRAFAVAADISF